MFRVASSNVSKRLQRAVNPTKRYSTEGSLPAQADVVIIGGGSIGCNVLYQLSKRGVSAVLLEQAKVTSGTTWHTAGLHWRLRPNDIEVQLLATTKNVLESLEAETGLHSGYIQNGGIFIARSKERIQEYQRLHTLGHFFGIESQLLNPEEVVKLSPALDPNDFTAALYSPGDGVIDPSQFCSSLIKGATMNGGKLFENCPVTNLVLDRTGGIKKVVGVETDKGTIKTNFVVNACGAWANKIARMADVDIPLAPMKHAYIVTESIPEVKGTPNIRDHDASVYFRIQGDSICMGGYEPNPELLRDIPNDFQFGLYELDHSIFDVHIEKATKLCPTLGKVGIKSTVCGPESFTPDHKPLMGEDPKCYGLYHACGFNSAGMMLSSGCAEQLAIWLTRGRPDLPMFPYDIRRFTTSMRSDRSWIVETSHESYVKNYSIVFPHDQFLSGRNLQIDPFHEVLVAHGAVMEQAQGWERPGYYIKDSTAPVRNYDWYGYYDHVKNPDQRYSKQLERDYTFNFSKNHDIIGEECLAARNNVALFDLSYFTKLYLTGPDAQEAADWLFTANTDREPEKVVYTCSLNSKGGVEADCTVMPLVQGAGRLVGPILKGKGYYIVAGGGSGYHTISHLKKQLYIKKFKSVITDVTDKMGILSIQGPKSGELLQSITETPITDQNFPFGMSHLVTINGHTCRAMRISFVGELGYELHIPTASCLSILSKVEEAGRSFDMKFAGYRSLYSLSCEKGYHLWNHDLRGNDNPVEAGLGFVCRKEGPYQGKDQVDKLKKQGAKKKRVFFTIPDKTVAVYGLETIWRDDTIVGFLRRGEYAYHLDCSLGIGFVEHPEDKVITDEFLKTGRYEIEVMGTRYPAILHTTSPFDPTNQRLMGHYEHHFQEQSHFED
ncbi:PREDICTED: sarcosine dehydrogenase, mitochondrial [Nicrophorus vespilloides]|uniref:Sarcosine dehydrogenase, mitochondrial n=1 Tax=Nicrophorus vespilloides TaxID=110193 RepID=A0ABM1NCU7_NICVS|nr:PREDICTED: sarcosine dehydrogenase, mitochondrial [Nicrophorus vespilloides]